MEATSTVGSPDDVDFDAPIGSVNLFVEGLEKLSIENFVEEFKELGNASTVGKLYEELFILNQKLEALGVFKSVKTVVKAGTSPHDVELVIHVVEKKWSQEIFTSVDQGGKVCLDVSSHIPSIFGSLNSLNILGSLKVPLSFELSGNLVSPRLPWSNRFGGRLSVFNAHKDYRPQVSFSEYSNGCSFSALSNCGTHRFQWEIIRRTVMPVMSEHEVSSPGITLTPLCSLKHSLKYTCTRDNYKSDEDTTGQLTQASGEIALPGGTTQFLKGEFSHAFSFPLFSDLVSHCSLAFGGMKTLDGNPSCIQDRFFMGGAFGCQRILRGFGTRGIGPSDLAWKKNSSSVWKPCRDDMGGDAYINSQLTVSLPVNRWVDLSRKVNVFAFLNAGSVVEKLRGDARYVAKEFLNNCGVAIGAGISLPLGSIGALDFLYAMPIKSAKTDTVCRFQFGLRTRLGDF